MKRPIEDNPDNVLKKQKCEESQNEPTEKDTSQNQEEANKGDRDEVESTDLKAFIRNRNAKEAEAETKLSPEERAQKVELEKTQPVVLNGFGWFASEMEFPTGTIYLPENECGASGVRNILKDCGLRTWSWYLKIRKGNIKDVRIGGRSLNKYPKDVLEDYRDFLEFDGSTEMFRFDFLTGEPVYVALDLKEYVVTVI